MNLPSKILATALLAATPAWFAGSAAAVPMGASVGLHSAAAPAPLEAVAWRGGWGGHGWGGRGWGWGGVGAGLAAGAIIGGAVAASDPWYGYGYDYGPSYYGSGYYGSSYYGSGYYGSGYDPGYYSYSYAAPGGYVAAAPGEDAAYCAQRFRSYDPASGTYLGYDGYRHPCP
jgi:hypothetical protein